VRTIDMTSIQRDSRPILDEVTAEAQRALRDRPALSIRARLTLGLVLWVILSVGIAIWSMLLVSMIETKLHFLESSQNYSFEIQQARRFEKNYLLYRSNLADAIEHVDRARDILRREEADMSSVMGRAEYDGVRQHLKRYEELLVQIERLEAAGAADAIHIQDIEAELRKEGGDMVKVANQLVAKEREQVDSMLRMSKRIPMLFVALLLIVIVALTYFIAKQMMAPLGRMMRRARGIAGGDLTPIVAKRKYRDEFSELALALNDMMQKLVHRHEQLLQSHKLRALGTLTAGVAHELNNPLNNIMLTSATLLDEYRDLNDDERNEMINDLIGESERSQRIVRNLLDFARESDIESEALSIEHVLEETMQLASNQIRHSKVKIDRRFDEDVAPVYGDRQQLTQVFLNIVLNALDAMPKGGELGVSIRNTRDREFVAVEISDTGVGIPEQKITEIFDPFFTTKKDGTGTGLGLSVSVGIVRKHGGDIQVSSVENKGTAFTVLLPAAKIPASAPETID
jgi:two-component system NtrC family sensor kinase